MSGLVANETRLDVGAVEVRLREARPNLVGVAIYDRLSRETSGAGELTEYQWRRREIENYLCAPETLENYARGSVGDDSLGPLFTAAEAERRVKVMKSCVADRVPPAALRDPADRYWHDTKASDELLDLVFPRFVEALGLPNLMNKSNYHVLARYVPLESLDGEIAEKFDAILATARKASAQVPAS